MFLPKLSSERKRLIESIRKRGNYEYNTNPLYNRGDIIVCRRPQPTKEKTMDDFVTCPNCKGYMAKKTMYQHYSKCNPGKPIDARNILQRGKALSKLYHSSACETLKTRIFPVMRDDTVFGVISHDQFLIRYGNKLCQKYRTSHFGKYIRQTLRTLGRVLIAIKEVDHTITDFASIINPLKYDSLIAAVNKIAHSDSVSANYRSPALVSNIGLLMKKCAKLELVQSIKEMDHKKKDEVENFLKILDEDYVTAVNKTAARNKMELKRTRRVSLNLEQMRCVSENRKEENAVTNDSVDTNFDGDRNVEKRLRSDVKSNTCLNTDMDMKKTHIDKHIDNNPTRIPIVKLIRIPELEQLHKSVEDSLRTPPKKRRAYPGEYIFVADRLLNDGDWLFSS